MIKLVEFLDRIHLSKRPPSSRRRTPQPAFECLEDLRLLSSINIPVTVLPAPAAISSGSTTTVFGPTYVLYNASNFTYQTAQSVAITTQPSSLAPPVTTTSITYNTIPLGYEPGSLPVTVLPAPASKTVGDTTITYGPTYTIYDSTSHTYQTAQPITAFSQKLGTQTQISYNTIPLGVPGGTYSTANVVPGLAPIVNGNTVTTYGPVFSLYDTTNHQFLTAQPITTSTPLTATKTQIYDRVVPIGYEAGTIAVSVLPALGPITSGNVITNYGPTFTVYDTTNQTFQTAQPVTTTSPWTGETNQITYNSIPLGASGHNLIPVSPLPGGPTNVNGTTVISSSPILSLYDATTFTYQTAQAITTFTPDSGYTTKITSSSVQLGYEAGGKPISVLAGQGSTTSGSTTTTFGPIYSIYDSTNNTYQSAQVISTTSPSGSLGPPVTVAQTSYTSTQLGYTASVIPVTVLPPPSAQIIGANLITYGPTYTIYDTATLTYQTAQPITTSTLPGSLAPPSTKTQVNYSTLAIGY